MSKLTDLVDILVTLSGPRIQPGSRAAHVNLNWGSAEFGTVREDGPARQEWERQQVKDELGRDHGTGLLGPVVLAGLPVLPFRAQGEVLVPAM